MAYICGDSSPVKQIHAKLCHSRSSMATGDPMKGDKACLDLDGTIVFVTVSPVGRHCEIRLEAGRAPSIGSIRNFPQGALSLLAILIMYVECRREIITSSSIFRTV